MRLYTQPTLITAQTNQIFLYEEGEDVREYIRLMGLKECPLYQIYGKAYDCWCSVYKTPADFAVLAINNPEFFARFVELESRLRRGGSGLFYNLEKIYLRDIASNPRTYLEKYPRLYKYPLCRALI